MRIIAGIFKGRRLTVPRGDTTRPTADQVRIALMDTLTPRLAGARVPDLLYRAGERFDVVFLDPPYDGGLVETTLETLGGGGLLLAEGWVIAQHFTKRPPAERVGALFAFRTRRFGETTLTFYRWASAPFPG